MRTTDDLALAGDEADRLEDPRLLGDARHAQLLKFRGVEVQQVRPRDLVLLERGRNPIVQLKVHQF